MLEDLRDLSSHNMNVFEKQPAVLKIGMFVLEYMVGLPFFIRVAISKSSASLDTPDSLIPLPYIHWLLVI